MVTWGGGDCLFGGGVRLTSMPMTRRDLHSHCQTTPPAGIGRAPPPAASKVMHAPPCAVPIDEPYGILQGRCQCA